MVAPDFFILQDDGGITPDANSYADIDFFVDYCASRGRIIVDPLTTAQYTDAQIAVALILGRDYMDGRWGWIGFRQQIDQTTEWPRLDAFDSSNSYVNGITDTLRRAQCEYAFIALTSGVDLNPAPDRDTTGVAVQSKTTQVGPILESIHYVAGAVFVNPSYPAADNILKSRGYTINRSTLMRG
jgi:hypothetical protein